uniref:Uncharacterized protein n=1 Tax=Arion vulgaris TaxID=1028688 RepID=A0A0B7B540_9EUPU
MKASTPKGSMSGYYSILDAKLLSLGKCSQFWVTVNDICVLINRQIYFCIGRSPTVIFVRFPKQSQVAEQLSLGK